MATIAKEIKEYEHAPRFYAPAWVNFPLGTRTCYPFGIHLIARGVRSLYLWLKHYGEAQDYKLWRRGYQCGYDQALYDHKIILPHKR